MTTHYCYCYYYYYNILIVNVTFISVIIIIIIVIIIAYRASCQVEGHARTTFSQPIVRSQMKTAQGPASV